MAFNPIAVLDQVTDEYRDYIQTEFRARDAALRERLIEALDRKHFLAREPFFQAHRPFKPGKKWRQLPLDEKLATVMEHRAQTHGSPTWDYAYTHQSGAIDELLSDQSRPVVVTTGTGSGKTEAFLLPVLQNALMDARTLDGKPGLTAILIYPMNALANDQRERIDSYVVAADLFGYNRQFRLLQVNAEETELLVTNNQGRVRCSVCRRPLAGAAVDMPCPRCHGTMEEWPLEDFESNRAVRRVQQGTVVPLLAGEHTAQVPVEQRKELEQKFKEGAGSSLNVLACSPTLEMGIDVGGLEAVAMRNVPPRPDNYAQRGGRAGRRARVGLVVGYASRRAHDQYFYDHPEEMIAGEVPIPTFSLANRDILLRHTAAIAFGAADPGLAGKMETYVSVDGQIQQVAVDALKAAVTAKADHATQLALQAFGQQLDSAQITEADLKAHLASMSERIQDVVSFVFILHHRNRAVPHLRLLCI